MIRFGEMFEDHMVLQCRKPVQIWGTCDAEQERITVRLHDVTGVDVVSSGIFQVTLPPMEPGGPYELQVSCCGEELVLQDVLIGEVWLAGGQSNMEMPLFAAEGAYEYLAGTRFRQLRLKTISRRSCSAEGTEYGFHFIPETSDPVPWKVADFESAAAFSAIGVVAGQYIQQELDMPVGIISCNYGATRIQPWVSMKTLKRSPVFAGDIERFQARREALGAEADSSWKAFQKSLQPLIRDRNTFMGRSLQDPLYYCTLDNALRWPPEYATGDQNEPGCLYRLMLARVFPYTLRGVLWYQGESSATHEDCYRYKAEMEALIDDWRCAFQDPSLAFVQAQLAPYDTSRRRDPCDWPAVRQAQAEVCHSRKDVYLTSLIGLGEERLIHPRYKIEAGVRMANTALANVYNRPAPEAPYADHIRRDGEWLEIRFRHGKGLRRTEEALQLECGADGVFSPATESEILENGLWVRTSEREVRYGWCGYPTEGLKNKDDLAAMPFTLKEKK